MNSYNLVTNNNQSVLISIVVAILIIVGIWVLLGRSVKKTPRNKSTSARPEHIRLALSETANTERQEEISVPKYTYRLREHIMTSYEEQVFRKLCEIFQDKCYVIPQVHLSKLFDHKIKGQNWHGAFAHINGKSVDFILLKKNDLSPLCAIEIDDWTHRTTNRKERDKEVERLFASVKLPLLRLRDIEYMTKQDIVDYVAGAINKN